MAGQQAVQRSANVEAITHLTTALDLLTTLPDTPERLQQELMLQVTLGAPLIAAKGYTREVGQAYARALELCEQVGNTPQLLPVLVGLWRFYLLQGELKTARKLGERLLTLAQKEQDSAILLEAHRTLVGSLLFSGEFILAREYGERGMSLYTPQQHRSHALRYGLDPGVSCLTYGTLALWYLGYPEQALKQIQALLSFAHELAHPFSLAFALIHTATLHKFGREVHVTHERAEAAIALSTEQGLAFWLAFGTVLRGWVLTEQGQEKEGIAQIQQSITAMRAMGAELWRPYVLALLAEAYGKVGEGAEGLVVLTEALATVDRTEERFYEAELYRLRGELTLRAGEKAKWGNGEMAQIPDPSAQILEPKGEAEACFLKAIEVARKQQAKSLELRAVMSLARLWQSQVKSAEAHRMLSEVYNWFTEGFDTKDLQEAKALLEVLHQ